MRLWVALPVGVRIPRWSRFSVHKASIQFPRVAGLIPPGSLIVYCSFGCNEHAECLVLFANITELFSTLLSPFCLFKFNIYFLWLFNVKCIMWSLVSESWQWEYIKSFSRMKVWLEDGWCKDWWCRANLLSGLINRPVVFFLLFVQTAFSPIK